MADIEQIQKFVPRDIASIISQYNDFDRTHTRNLMKYVVREIDTIESEIAARNLRTFPGLYVAIIQTFTVYGQCENVYVKRDLWKMFNFIVAESKQYKKMNVKPFPNDISPKRLCAHCRNKIYEQHFSIVKNMCRTCHTDQCKKLHQAYKRVYVPRPSGFNRYPVELQNIIIEELRQGTSLRNIHRIHSPKYPMLSYWTLARLKRENKIPL